MREFYQFVLHILIVVFKRAVYCGKDQFGNRYYELFSKSTHRKTRFVFYGAVKDPSAVAPDWFNWLHYTTNKHPQDRSFPSCSWQKPALPNLTGTLLAYKKRQQQSNEKLSYTPWKPKI